MGSNKILTIEEARQKGVLSKIFGNGDYKYNNEHGIECLIRDGKEIASGLFVYSYNNGDYDYEDEEGNYHYFNKYGEEIER